MWVIKGVFTLLWEIIYEIYTRMFLSEGDLWEDLKNKPEFVHCKFIEEKD